MQVKWITVNWWLCKRMSQFRVLQEGIESKLRHISQHLVSFNEIPRNELRGINNSFSPLIMGRTIIQHISCFLWNHNKPAVSQHWQVVTVIPGTNHIPAGLIRPGFINHATTRCFIIYKEAIKINRHPSFTTGLGYLESFIPMNWSFSARYSFHKSINGTFQKSGRHSSSWISLCGWYLPRLKVLAPYIDDIGRYLFVLQSMILEPRTYTQKSILRCQILILAIPTALSAYSGNGLIALIFFTIPH